MASIWDGVGSILSWFSPEQRAKAKRIKLQNLQDERARLEKGPCTEAASTRISQIDDQIKTLQRDLES